MENSTGGNGNSTFARHQTHLNYVLSNGSVLWKVAKYGLETKTVTMKKK